MKKVVEILIGTKQKPIIPVLIILLFGIFTHIISDISPLYEKTYILVFLCLSCIVIFNNVYWYLMNIKDEEDDLLCNKINTKNDLLCNRINVKNNIEILAVESEDNTNKTESQSLSVSVINPDGSEEKVDQSIIGALKEEQANAKTELSKKPKRTTRNKKPTIKKDIDSNENKTVVKKTIKKTPKKGTDESEK